MIKRPKMEPTLPKKRDMPAWLLAAPWVLVVATIILAATLLVLGMSRSHKESEISAALYMERGASLLYAYEATLRTGMGLKWSYEELQQVLDMLATAPDIYYMAVTDTTGYVLAASNQSLVGKQLLSPEEMLALNPGEAPRGWLEKVQDIGNGRDSANIFLVFKAVNAPMYRERLMHGHTMMRRLPPNLPILPQMRNRLQGTESKELVAFVGYDIQPLLQAREMDARQSAINWFLLFFLGLVSLLTLFLVNSQQKARRIVRESNALTFALIDTLPLGIIAVDENGRITTCNPEATHITGLDPDSCLGSPLYDTLPDLYAVLKSRGLLGLQRPTHEQESRILFGQGRRVPLALSVAPIVTEDGIVMGDTIMLRDLGEIHKLQAELRRQDRLAALGSMAAGVAHEIRNPLGAIKGLARFFQETTPPDGEEARVAAIMTNEVQRLDKVVGDLLELSRPDQLNISNVNPVEFFERLADLLKTDLENSGIELKLNIPENRPEIVMDNDRMTQVFLNLMLNAIQAMPDGGTLSIGLRFEPEFCQKLPGECTQVLFEVADNGHGMEADKLGSIFQPYFTTKAKGTGLGLSLVHKIIEAHDGEIRVQSEPGKGSCFTIILPLPLREANDGSGGQI